MTLSVNACLEAIAAQLEALFPKRLVFVDRIEAGADGNHLIRCVEQSQERALGPVRRRAYSFEVAYFANNRDPLGFNAWAEALYPAFEYLQVGENKKLLHCQNCQARDGEDMVYHFTFEVEFFLITPEDKPLMQTLELDQEEKG